MSHAAGRPSFVLNGKPTTLDADPTMPLLWAVRELAGLHRHQVRLRHGAVRRLHGASGRPGDPLLRDAAVRGRRRQVTTIEGCRARRPRQCRRHGSQLQVPQCGYCQSGQIMSATALLEKNAAPTDADIDAAMSGNICRCGTYQRIRAAIHAAAQAIKA
jgi:isoquinoline 1-oxidoreductase alpha subunit